MTLIEACEIVDRMDLGHKSPDTIQIEDNEREAIETLLHAAKPLSKLIEAVV